MKNSNKRYSEFFKYIVVGLNLPKQVKTSIVISIDALLGLLSIWLAFYLRLGDPVLYYENMHRAALLSVVLPIAIFFISGLYRERIRYAGFKSLLSIIKCMLLYGVTFSLIVTVFGLSGVPRTIGLIQPTLMLIFVCMFRVLVRFWLIESQDAWDVGRRNVLIYGAGTAGRQLYRAIESDSEIRICGFLDDNPYLHGQKIDSLRIYDPKTLPDVVSRLDAKEVYLALPRASPLRRNEILESVRKCRISVRTIPSFSNLLLGIDPISAIQELDVNDLLGRETVEPRQELFSKTVFAKIVMVTGAGGSIGSELCRQISSLKPKKLILVENSEASLYQIHLELLENFPNLHIIPLLASVQNKNRIESIIKTWCPNIIYHAAAYKHVPLVEQNIFEGIQNNVNGTLVVCEAAIRYGVETFVLISTDKAVRPTNVMGATKRLAEMIIQSLAEKQNKTIFCLVRFGNVLGSSGSVVPRFREQIKAGGPVTVTHPDITRFFMSIPEAAQLVIQAGAMSEGGEVFVLDMGELVRITDLATQMIELSGHSVKGAGNSQGTIEIKFVGLRPGEKLYEELLIEDGAMPTVHPRIIKANERFLNWEKMERVIFDLNSAIEMGEYHSVYQILDDLVVGFNKNRPFTDLVQQAANTDARN